MIRDRHTQLESKLHRQLPRGTARDYSALPVRKKEDAPEQIGRQTQTAKQTQTEAQTKTKTHTQGHSQRQTDNPTNQQRHSNSAVLFFAGGACVLAVPVSSPPSLFLDSDEISNKCVYTIENL